jgi:hypothetical protein
MATSQCIDAARGKLPVLAPAMDGVLGHARVPGDVLDGEPRAASSAAAASTTQLGDDKNGRHEL